MDYASHDCENAFFKEMENTGQMRAAERPTDLQQNRNFRQGSNFQPNRYNHDRYNNVNSPRDSERYVERIQDSAAYIQV